ncbi:MAG: dTDP-4-amino-4,6-dideoxygalactose transaminase [Halanaerobiales bacterium]|nr:dTDP-4-amino-4,6-dideoxygalactose transaminase [Halanaerobiales bacterium]
MLIPFNKIYYTGNELRYIEDALEKGQLTGDGEYSGIVCSFLEKKFGINKVLVTTTATHALEMAAMLIGLRPGDEVIMPSFTFPSTANAVLLQGARPVFAEIREETLNIDPLDIERKISQKTRAIIPVHYAGNGCELERVIELADQYNLLVIEDAAQAVNARYRNKYLGTWGDIGCYSFHGTKNYICGEGGAIAINSQHNGLLEQAEIISEKGTDRTRFLRGEREKYSWMAPGSSYLPSNLLMAFLYAQLEQLDDIKSRRKIIFNYYSEHLQSYLGQGIIKGISRIPSGCDPNYHLFYLLFPNERVRDKARALLKEKGISALFHYQPLHSAPMGRKLGYQAGDLPITEGISSSILRLPFYTGMTAAEMEYVVEQIRKVIKEL